MFDDEQVDVGSVRSVCADCDVRLCVATHGWRKQAEVYNAPDTALGSNLPRRGEKRTADTKEVSGDAVDAMRDSIRPVAPKGLGN